MHLAEFKSIYSVLLMMLGFVILISCSVDTNSTSSGLSEKKNSVTFNLEINHNKLNIDSSTLKVTQGDQVVLNILKSDEEGILHLHGYGLATRVGLEKSGTIEFEANATGNFEMAFHPHSTETKSSTEGHIVLGKFQVYPR